MHTETVSVGSALNFMIEGVKAKELLKADKEAWRFHLSSPVSFRLPTYNISTDTSYSGREFSDDHVDLAVAIRVVLDFPSLSNCMP